LKTFLKNFCTKFNENLTKAVMVGMKVLTDSLTYSI